MKKPLNLIVFEDLFNKIKSNYYSLGDKLPTESEMQKIYNVSRAPIRQALGRLQSEGLIARKPGIGTIVIENSVEGPWTPMGGFSFQLSKQWNNLICKTIDVSNVIAEKEVMNKLELKSGTPVTKVTRIRVDNDVPVFLLRHHYHNVDIDKIRKAGDIFFMRQFAAEVLDINFAYVNEEITAVTADEQLGYYLEVDEGFPLLKIKRTSFDPDYKPVEYVEYFVKSNHWPYKIMYSKDGGELDM